jgi:hypothetical protein
MRRLALSVASLRTRVDAVARLGLCRTTRLASWPSRGSALTAAWTCCTGTARSPARRARARPAARTRHRTLARDPPPALASRANGRRMPARVHGAARRASRRRDAPSLAPATSNKPLSRFPPRCALQQAPSGRLASFPLCLSSRRTTRPSAPRRPSRRASSVRPSRAKPAQRHRVIGSARCKRTPFAPLITAMLTMQRRVRTRRPQRVPQRQGVAAKRAHSARAAPPKALRLFPRLTRCSCARHCNTLLSATPGLPGAHSLPLSASLAACLTAVRALCTHHRRAS